GAELPSHHRHSIGYAGAVPDLGVPIMNSFPVLTALICIPLIGAVLIIGLNPQQKRLARSLAFAFSLVALALAVTLWIRFNPRTADLQFEEVHAAWIPTLAAVQYHLGVDGLGLLMVLLSAIVVPMAIVASWKIEDRVPIYFSLVLFLQAGLFGT